MGVMKARVALDPVTDANYKSGQLKNVQKWLAKLTPVTPDPQKVDAYVKDRETQVREACSMFQAGKGRYENPRTPGLSAIVVRRGEQHSADMRNRVLVKNLRTPTGTQDPL